MPQVLHQKEEIPGNKIKQGSHKYLVIIICKVVTKLCVQQQKHFEILVSNPSIGYPITGV